MAHNIHVRNGEAQAWYADKPAWHGLGTVTAGAKTARQVIAQVPLFRKQVVTSPVYVKIGGRMVEAPSYRATHRQGETEVLGVVSDEYTVLQDTDGLLTMEAIVNAARRSSFVSAFGLGNGSRCSATIDLSRVLNLRVKRDPSAQEGYLFGDWRHDGMGSLNVGLWVQRVDCNNMLDAANASATSKGLLVRIRHTGDASGRVAEAQQALGFVEKQARQYVQTMNALADVPLPTPTAKWLAEFGERLIPIPEDAVRTTTRQEARDLITTLYRKSSNLQTVPESPYRVLQAVVEYADHYRPLRPGQKSQEQISEARFRSITEGPAANLKDQAMELLRQEFLVPVSAN